MSQTQGASGSSVVLKPHPPVAADSEAASAHRSNTERGTTPATPAGSFEQRFVALYHVHYHRLFRYLDRLSGDAELAADITQETFIRLGRRGEMPDSPGPWLVTVAVNLFRNVRAGNSRRLRLLTPERGEALHSNAATSPDVVLEAAETQQKVREALNALPDREQRMLLLRAEGYSYREIAQALALNEASVGTLLSRAQRALLTRYEESARAS